MVDTCLKKLDLFTFKTSLFNGIGEYRESINITNILTNKEQALLDKPPIKIEITLILQKLQINKSPGLDWIPSEFYSAFWDELSELYMGMAIIENELQEPKRFPEIDMHNILYKCTTLLEIL